MKSNIFALSTSACVLSLAAHIGSAACAETVWDYSPVGHCSSHFKVPRSSPNGDLAVQIEKRVDAHKNRYVWTWDPTPERNPTRQLTRVTPAGVGCVVLFLPYSDANDFKLTPGGGLPEKVISQSSPVDDEEGGHYVEHEYTLDKSTGMYRKWPTCYVVGIVNKQRAQVNCAEAGQDQADDVFKRP